MQLTKFKSLKLCIYKKKSEDSRFYMGYENVFSIQQLLQLLLL